MANIFFLTGSIFDMAADAVVIPVNCVGVTGAGVAKEWKKRFSKDVIEIYRNHCNDQKGRDSLRLGGRSLFISGDFTSLQPASICFPTKYHYRESSSLAMIKKSLEKLVGQLNSGSYSLFHIKSIAIPYVGCGLGGLDKEVVEDLIVDSMEKWEGGKVYVVDYLLSKKRILG